MHMLKIIAKIRHLEYKNTTLTTFPIKPHPKYTSETNA